MLKKLKRTLIIGCVAAMLLSSSVSAASQNFSFSITTNQANNSSSVEKGNFDDHALVSISSSNLSYGVATADLTLQDIDYTRISDYTFVYKNISGLGITYYLSNGKSTGEFGGLYHLRADYENGPRGYATLSGNWTP